MFPVEVWGGFHAEVGGGSGAIESRYVPQVASAPGAEGSAGQTLALDPGAGGGVEVGVNLFPARSLGIQGFVGGHSVLFADEFRLRVAFEPATAPGPREVEAVLALGPVTLSPRRLALTVGLSLR